MNKYISPYSVHKFQILSTPHMVALAVILAACLLIIAFRQRLRAEKMGRLFRYTLAFLVILPLIAYQAWAVVVGEWSVNYSLPLWLCDLTLVLSAAMLIWRKNSSSIFELVYMWGLAGSLQALLTPDLFYSFPHFLFFKFFLAHGIVMLVIAFFVFVEGCCIRPGAAKRVFLVTNVYALAMAVFNYCTGSNYFYLCQKPDMPSLLDYLGPWPWYVLFTEPIMIAVFYMLSIPFIIEEELNVLRQ